MTSGGNNFSYFAENQLAKFSAGDAGDFNQAAGEREMAPKCGSLPRDAGDLALQVCLTSLPPPGIEPGPSCFEIRDATTRLSPPPAKQEHLRKSPG